MLFWLLRIGLPLHCMLAAALVLPGVARADTVVLTFDETPTALPGGGFSAAGARRSPSR